MPIDLTQTHIARRFHNKMTNLPNIINLMILMIQLNAVNCQLHKLCEQIFIYKKII